MHNFPLLSYINFSILQMQKLSDSTVRQISSGQVISDIPCVVKELVENALDSGASRIDISLVS